MEPSPGQRSDLHGVHLARPPSLYHPHAAVGTPTLFLTTEDRSCPCRRPTWRRWRLPQPPDGQRFCFQCRVSFRWKAPGGGPRMGQSGRRPPGVPPDRQESVTLPPDAGRHSAGGGAVLFPPRAPGCQSVNSLSMSTSCGGQPDPTDG